MVGQLVESNGDRFFPAPKLHHPNASRAHSGLPNFDHFTSVEHRKKSLHATAIFMTSLCRVVQILQLIKFFQSCFEKCENFFLSLRAKDNFSQMLIDWLLRAEIFAGQFWDCALWDDGVGFSASFRSHSILFFVFCIVFLCFAQLCQTIAAFLLKVKMKTLVERCLSNYTLMEIFSVFLCLTFCEIFCKFLCFLLVYFTRYWLIICW